MTEVHYEFSSTILERVSGVTRNSMKTLVESLVSAERVLVSYHSDQPAYFSPDAENLLKELQQSARLIVTMSFTKAVFFTRSIIQCTNEENFLMTFLALRGYVELAAALRYTANRIKPLVQEAGSTGQITPAVARELAKNLSLLLVGGRFDWKTYFEQGASGVIDRKKLKRTQAEKERFETNSLRIGKCIKDWGQESPAAEFIYDYLCDLVHPNKGSNLILLTEREGRAVFDARGERKMGVYLFDRIFPYAISMCIRTMAEVPQLMALVGAEDKEPARH